MTNNIAPTRTWAETLRTLLHPSVIAMLFLGLAAGLPYLLIFSTLSLWLGEAGVTKANVTFFSWAALSYSFKFVWAPLVDRLPLPFLTPWLGRRRAWLLLAQIAIIGSMLLMAATDPAATDGVFNMAIAATLLGFSASTQDIVIDAYRIESAAADLQAMLSSTYIAGYRIGMLITGAGALFLASLLGSQVNAYQYTAWMFTYITMAAIMLVGPITTLLIPEPQAKTTTTERSLQDQLELLLVFVSVAITFITVFLNVRTTIENLFSHLLLTTQQLMDGIVSILSLLMEITRLGTAIFAAWLIVYILASLKLVQPQILHETYLAPIQEFFKRYGSSTAWTFLILISVYRIPDILLGVIANVFYQDMGFTKIEIASIVKTYGLFMTLLGGFLGGALTVRYGVIRILFVGTSLSIATHLSFMLLTQTGHNILMLYLVISADNLSAGLSVAAFVAFVSSLTSVSFTAVQYAIFSSMMTLFPKILGGYSGTMVDMFGYQKFFLVTSMLGLPVLLVVLRAGRLLTLHETK